MIPDDELIWIDPTMATADPLKLPELGIHGIWADVLRLYKIHPVVSGNKWFKLKEHLRVARTNNCRHLVTFGGAWSNHLVAVAYAARESDIPVTGIVRGERPRHLSLTLQAASSYGMRLQFISRAEYAQKTREDPHGGLLSPGDHGLVGGYAAGGLAAEYPGSYIIPEGGAGPAGIKGSKEILSLVENSRYSHILCAIGTGTTYLGLAEASLPGQWVIGIPVLKGLDSFLTAVGSRLTDPGKLDHCRINTGYHFGGYARKSQKLLDFMNNFYRLTGIPTDFVYTAKLFYAALDMIGQGFFPSGSQILLLHSGGLQGNGSLAPGVLDF